jgi:hypothetical protein
MVHDRGCEPQDDHTQEQRPQSGSHDRDGRLRSVTDAERDERNTDGQYGNLHIAEIGRQIGSSVSQIGRGPMCYPRASSAKDRFSHARWRGDRKRPTTGPRSEEAGERLTAGRHHEAGFSVGQGGDARQDAVGIMG